MTSSLVVPILGVDDNGNQDKDRAVFEGNYLTGTDAMEKR